MHRLSLILIFVLGFTAWSACDLEVEIKNGSPVVTWLAAEPATSGVVDLTVWLYDVDRDPVDLTVTWAIDGVDQGPITLGPGGHGLVGTSCGNSSVSFCNLTLH